jgi:alpha,alpha-trehalose phosphorylase
VSAKGLTGQAYEGHSFWDTEIYLLPFLIYTSPRIARNLLTFRYQMLPQARARARQLGHKGAMFPWRTINGEEGSAYYAAGTAQYHINADIMYALRKYVQTAGDELFLQDCGAEMLVETARLWLDLGFYSERKGGAFCINGVTGPDEYNTVVNNNAYTNLMARENLRYAAETIEALRATQPDVYDALAYKTALQPSEVEAWKRAAAHMYVPYDEQTGMTLQDDSFLDKRALGLPAYAARPLPAAAVLSSARHLPQGEHSVILTIPVAAGQSTSNRSGTDTCSPSPNPAFSGQAAASKKRLNGRCQGRVSAERGEGSLDRGSP